MSFLNITSNELAQEMALLREVGLNIQEENEIYQLMPTCSRQTLVKDHAFLVKPAYYLKSLYGVRGFSCVKAFFGAYALGKDA